MYHHWFSEDLGNIGENMSLLILLIILCIMIIIVMRIYILSLIKNEKRQIQGNKHHIPSYINLFYRHNFKQLKDLIQDDDNFKEEYSFNVIEKKY